MEKVHDFPRKGHDYFQKVGPGEMFQAVERFWEGPADCWEGLGETSQAVGHFWEGPADCWEGLAD